MFAFGVFALFLGLMCWTMATEMRRRPEGGFFRPVMIGVIPVLVFSTAGFIAAEVKPGADEVKAREEMLQQSEQLLDRLAGKKVVTREQLEQSMRFGLGTAFIFWVGLLSLIALGMRKNLVRRGLARPALPFSRWKAHDALIWLLLLPAALVALNQRGWLGEVEPWIRDLALNAVLIMLALYLFQGAMVLLDRLKRTGLSGGMAALMLIALLLGFTVALGAGALVGVLALGILDTWADFRKLTPKKTDNERSSS